LDIQEKGLIMARARRGRSEGSIYFRESDNKWVGSVSLGYSGNGKRKRRVVYGDSKKTVLDKMRAIQGETLADTGKLTTGEYLQRWLKNAARNSLQSSTLERYESIVRVHVEPILGRIQLRKLRPIHIEECYAQLERNGASARTRQLAGAVLTRALQHALKLELATMNPAAGIARATTAHREMLFLTEPQARAFLAAAEPHRLSALFVLAVASGMRQGELLGLAWSDIDFEKRSVTVVRSLSAVREGFVLKEPKSAVSRRTITLPPFAIDALQKHRAAMLAEGNISRPVFCTHNGNFIGKSNLIHQAFRPILSAANKTITELATARAIEPALLPPIRFHDLRHTHATTLLARGHSIKAISQRLGHKSIEITLSTYVHLMPNDDSVLADGLERMFG
jgi:integrase